MTLIRRFPNLTWAAIAAQGLDLATFYVGLALFGIEAEANPLLHAAFAFGILGPALLKVASLGFVLWLCPIVTYHAGHRAGQVAYGIVIVGGLVGCLANLASLIIWFVPD